MIRGSEPNRESGTAHLRLAGEFQLLIDERNVPVPHGVQRVLVFLAVARAPTPRTRIAGRLWSEVPERRALANLRSALWRLKRIPRRIVGCIDERLSLDRSVRVDIKELAELSSRVLEARDPAQLCSTTIPSLTAASDLLPDWEDDWLVAERERFRELRLHALERACEALLERGDYAGAIQAGLAAVECEPYRESARRLLVRVHLRQGNRAAALRSYLAYRQLLSRELGIEPSEQMLELVADLTDQRRRAT